MVLDCRKSNQHFHRPPSVSFFSAAGFGEVVCEDGKPMFFAGVDVKNAFYQHAIPQWLSEYFCFEPVYGWELLKAGVASFEGMAVVAETSYFPQLSVAPMGWSWAPFLVQTAHAHILARDAALDDRRVAVDFRPPRAQLTVLLVRFTPTTF